MPVCVEVRHRSFYSGPLRSAEGAAPPIYTGPGNALHYLERIGAGFVNIDLPQGAGAVPPTHELARQVLETNGYTVHLAEDGKKAIELYAQRSGEIDLVILDLTMPHRSGMEVFRSIREMNPRARVILSSGNMPAEPVQGAVFLPKPYRPDALVRAVRSILDAPIPAR